MDWLFGLVLLLGIWVYLQPPSNAQQSNPYTAFVEVSLPADASALLNPNGISDKVAKEDASKLLNILAEMAKLQERSKHLRTRADAQALQQELNQLNQQFAIIKQRYNR